MLKVVLLVNNAQKYDFHMLPRHDTFRHMGCAQHLTDYLSQVSTDTFDVGGAAAASGFGASGNITSASLSMGSPAVTLPSQVFGVADSVGDGLATVSCDGFMVSRITRI